MAFMPYRDRRSGGGSRRNIRRPLLYLVLLLGFGLRLYRLDYQSFWWDEMYTAARAAMSVPELIDNLLASKVHLPPYFLLIGAWSALGRSEFILRYFSLIWGMCSIALIYRIGRLLGGERVGLLAAFLLAIAPFHIWYSQEARMYTFLAAVTLVAHWFLLRLFDHDTLGNWVGYTLAMVGTVYAHYLGLLILAAHYTYFSLHYRHQKALFKRWVISGAVTGAAFSLWGIMVLLNGAFKNASISWIAPAHWYEPFFTLLSFSAGPSIDPSRPAAYVALLAYLLGLAASLFYLARSPAGRAPAGPQLSARLLFTWLAIPLLLLMLISLKWPIPQRRSIYMDRYLISTLPAFILLGAWGITTLTGSDRRPWLSLIFIGAVLLPTLLSWRNLYHDADYARQDWHAAFEQIESAWQRGDILVHTPGQLLPLYYYTDGGLSRVEVSSLLEYDEAKQEAQLHREMIEWLYQAGSRAGRAWLIESYHNTNPHGFPQTRNARVAAGEEDGYGRWLKGHYRAIGSWSFTGINLTIYDLRQPLTTSS